MARRSKTPATRGARVRTHVRLLLDEEIALGPGKADLLEAIRDQGSISAAGKQLGMSYRRAWLLVDTMNRCFRTPLVLASTGGASGGGAVLSVNGAAVLRRYRSLEAAVSKLTQRAFDDFAPLLRESPPAPDSTG